MQQMTLLHMKSSLATMNVISSLIHAYLLYGFILYGRWSGDVTGLTAVRPVTSPVRQSLANPYLWSFPNPGLEKTAGFANPSLKPYLIMTKIYTYVTRSVGSWSCVFVIIDPIYFLARNHNRQQNQGYFGLH